MPIPGPEFLKKSGTVTAPDNSCTKWALVHRTHRAASPTVDEIALSGHIRTCPAGSAAEVERGQPRNAYLFVGAGAYPKGLVAFLFEPTLVNALPATFTPFDSGGLGQNRFTQPGTPLEVYDCWCTTGKDLTEVLPHYVQLLFDDADEYVKRLTGEPDRPPPHGVHSATGFRGAWTVEVQVQVDLPLDPWLRRVVFARRAIALRAPNEWLVKGSRAPEVESSEEEFAQSIAVEILRVR